MLGGFSLVVSDYETNAKKLKFCGEGKNKKNEQNVCFQRQLFILLDVLKL